MKRLIPLVLLLCLVTLPGITPAVAAYPVTISVSVDFNGPAGSTRTLSTTPTIPGSSLISHADYQRNTEGGFTVGNIVLSGFPDDVTVWLGDPNAGGVQLTPGPSGYTFTEGDFTGSGVYVLFDDDISPDGPSIVYRLTFVGSPVTPPSGRTGGSGEPTVARDDGPVGQSARIARVNQYAPVYDQPDKTCPVIGKAYLGESILLQRWSGDFCLVLYNGGNNAGWVLGKYIQAD